MALSRRAPRLALRAALVAIAVYYAVWGGEYSAFDLSRLDRLTGAEAEGLAAARTEADSLRARAERLESDPATIERVARERFGMIREGELLYRFVHVDPAAAPDTKVATAP